jgi:hydrogenase expression/formation protein HypD
MRYLDEFRDGKLASRLAEKIKKLMPTRPLNFMEVCGTHTQSFHRFALGRLLPGNLRLIAGPGCPVCVSTPAYIDQAISLSALKDVIILTFGDMLRVPGSHSSLEHARARGRNVQVVYSPLDCLALAKANPDKRLIFLAVGFETTAPTIALTIKAAKKDKIKNLFFLASLKTIPQVMEQLIKDSRLNLQGFLCPGHVSTIIGTRAYDFIPRKYGISCSVAGFEALDILNGIYLLVRQNVQQRPRVENQYVRVATRNGNPRAIKLISDVFKPADVCWRGLGLIPGSGLTLRREYARFDAAKEFVLKVPDRQTGDRRQADKCRCGDVLKGIISPPQCPLFGRACNPLHAVGPCMVSSEGACNAYYKYH